MTDTTPSRPRRLLPISRLFTWGAALAIPLALAGEAWSRFDDYRQYGTPWNASPDLNADLMVHDSMGFRGRPSGQYMGSKLNSAGFRSPESALQFRPDCPLVMTLGSSETFGYEERPGKEYPSQLADSLARAGCYRVLNAGVVGMSLPSMMQTYALWGARFRPDIVVLLASPLPYVYDEPPVVPAPAAVGSPSIARRSPRPRLVAKVKQMISFPPFIQRRRVERMVEALSAGRPASWFFTQLPKDRLELFGYELAQAIAAIQATGAEPIVVVHPLRFSSLRDPEAQAEMQSMRQFGARPLPAVLFAFDSAGAERTRQVATAAGVPIADMPKLMNGRRDLFSDPVHYSEAGAAVMAAEIQRVIRSLPKRAAVARVDAASPR